MLITQYRLAWNPDKLPHNNFAPNTGAIDVVLENGANQRVPIDSPQEFIIVALMLSKQPCRLDNGLIYTDPRPVGT